MSARKIGLLLLLLAFGASVETAWQVRGDVRFGPEGCRVVGGRFYGPSYAFEETAERPAGAAAHVEVKNAFGGVTVAPGPAGVVKVRLRKVVFLATEEKARAFAQRVELRLAGEGASLRVGTNRDDVARGEETGFETNLELEVPADAAVVVRNEHGRVDVSGVASADVTSSFEGVSVERVSGELRVESRHGEVRVEGVAGDASISSRHGQVEVRGVKGRVSLDVEHGGLTVHDTGPLEVKQQHGGVSVETVSGSLLVRAGHSEVEAQDVTGTAEVETSFGAVRLSRVGGDAVASVEHGHVSAEDVSGRLEARSSHGGVDVKRVGGRLEAEVRSGGLEAGGLANGATVRGAGGDVTIDGFVGGVEIELERGSARLRPRAAIAAPVTVSVRQGEASLQVPDGSRVDVEAESRRGEVRSDVAGLAARSEKRGRGSRVEGALGGGGTAVRLHAEGDVTLEPTSASAIADREIAKPQGSPAEAPVSVQVTPEASPAPAAAPAKPAEAASEPGPAPESPREDP